jgi:hypothetical protein
MSVNIPVVSDTSWAVGGRHRHDYGNESTTHFCVFTSGGSCIVPSTSDFSDCTVRCFGYGFTKPAQAKPVFPRTIVDIYEGQPRWSDDGKVDLWEYPKNCSEAKSYGVDCLIDKTNGVTPSFNPQGFVFTQAGSGKAAFTDGAANVATFNHPEGIAVDRYGIIYVADTDNNAIRKVQPNGYTSTIAGQGPHKGGFLDGHCSEATFSKPKDLDIRYDFIDGVETLIIVVADTGNHRLRRIDIVEGVSCIVSCLSGLCGNDTRSETDFKFQAVPYAGYADGPGLYARFSAPESVVFIQDDGSIAVADTGNFLIRWVLDNGTTFTLAGDLVNGPRDADGNPVGGCPLPCMVGVPGFRDGNLSYAQFYNPVDLAKGPNNTIYVADENRIRLIALPHINSTVYTITNQGYVVTIAGNSYQGSDDGPGDKSTFFDPTGIFVTEDTRVYTTDYGTCKIRRIDPIPTVAPRITCSTQGRNLIRPSGCTSYDMPFDKIGRKITNVEANVLYSYSYPYENEVHHDRGKYIKNCVGVPPPELLDKHSLNVTGDNLVIDDHRLLINEDSEEGQVYVVECPSNCGSSGTDIYGNHWYGDNSGICAAAVHDGIIDDSEGGYVRVEFQRRAFVWGTTYNESTTSNGITSQLLSESEQRIFSMEPIKVSVVIVRTVSGHPSAHLEDGCGFRNAQPAQAALFNKPKGIAAYNHIGITNGTFLYIADSGNNMIRGISAVCSQICENGGVCVASDTCHCPTGWSGIDCTIPSCSIPCGPNNVCVAPNTCSCKPGYEGLNCNSPQCIQTCLNGGTCSAPDTCTCANGWFDTNCSTPVCDKTCANGGNCTAPNVCACPSQWSGSDCRTPVCKQTCHNGGYCVAPDTCICPPQWINFDCSVPVCTQGYFKKNPTQFPNHLYSTHLEHWPTYKQCNIETWCHNTYEFECYQDEMERIVMELPSGGSWRAITGRKDRPDRCMQIELPIDYKIPFELLYSDNTTTPIQRYSPNAKYTSNPLNPWRGYEQWTEGHTGPWLYTPDRQIANVQWLNVSQGVYVCANGGNCTYPGICECAEGWMGFDCRTPVCNQGYFFPEQHKYVSGLETKNELKYFLKFMSDYEGTQLQWPYSNPNFTTQWEFFEDGNHSQTVHVLMDEGGERYLGPADWSTLKRVLTYQGGYRCSIRSMTQWENRDFIISHPNYYSRYMNPKVEKDGNIYTNWTGMEWPPVHQKSRIFVDIVENVTYIYTNEGWRMYGVWNRTQNDWEYGSCILEFNRNCSDPYKAYDLHSQRYNVSVQDTDLSYRARITYNDYQVVGLGRWVAEGGECTDLVVRGCFNNGTCIAPDTCLCAEGWSGYDCHIPVCSFTCAHNGNCTLPNTCTCERGWTGYDCTIPICAQECQNGGVCIAPDTCLCKQWENAMRDGREGGGRPIYRNPNGDPQMTGWTGYDCSVPICVQAEKFLFNTEKTSSTYESLGGHGGNNLLECQANGKELPRCPIYDEFVTGNDGRSFQTGCGYDMWYSGCCLAFPENNYACYKCDGDYLKIDEHTIFCENEPTVLYGKGSEVVKFQDFLDDDSNFRLCGRYHSPRLDGVAVYYVDKNPLYSSYNFKSNYTSDLYLCNVQGWTQGDYIDDAGLSDTSGVGSYYGLINGRHTRVNYPNIIGTPGTEDWTLGEKLPGEGIYACYNKGSCIAPDTCTCTDGYEGYDCNTPLCRHLQPSGQVTACLNGGICANRDDCHCVQADSVLWMAHSEASRGTTGWTGSDCSIPMCVQGYFDPFCTDLPQAPAGEGCYRCANGGNCTAPEVCTCAPGWSGYDCRTPLCEVVADPLTRTQLGTIFEENVISFETDPCGGVAIFGYHTWGGRRFTQGNCTQPNLCTCLCKNKFDVTVCDATGNDCDGAWQDPMWNYRDVLYFAGPTYVFGTTDCYNGYEGNVNELDQFVTCHQEIFIPTDLQKESVTLIVVFAVFGFFAIIFWFFIRQKLQKRYLLAKIERRRSKRSSEESLLQAGMGAFGNN